MANKWENASAAGHVTEKALSFNCDKEKIKMVLILL